MYFSSSQLYSILFYTLNGWSTIRVVIIYIFFHELFIFFIPLLIAYHFEVRLQNAQAAKRR